MEACNKCHTLVIDGKCWCEPSEGGVMDENELIRNLAMDIGTAYRDSNALDDMGLAIRLHNFGYRLDPYPNGKSKDELIKRIEELEAERDRARNLLFKSIQYESMLWLDPEACQEIDDFLAETSTVKS